MGQIVAYAIITSLPIFCFYLVYKWLLSGESMHRYNRGILLSVYLISLVIVPVAYFMLPSSGDSVVADATMAIGGASQIAVPTENESAQSVNWLIRTILWVYAIGLVVVAARSLMMIRGLNKMARSGERIRCGSFDLMIVDDDKLMPFSWFDKVVMNRKDWTECGRLILAHESAHIGLRHSYDVMLAQAVCILQWFNPAAWLLRDELKMVHEFQADQAVVSSDIDVREYQMLLIKKTVGMRFQALANSLNHSNLKKRITMMQNSNNGRSRRLRGLALAPALAAALFVTDLPAVAGLVTDAAQATAFRFATPTSADKGSKKIVADKVPQAMSLVVPDAVADANGSSPAQFPGDEMELYKFIINNLKYPEDAAKNNQQGRITLQFRISETGKVSDVHVIRGVCPSLDAEAVRVGNLLPDFIPAKENGKPVACVFTLPITFKIAGDSDDAE